MQRLDLVGQHFGSLTVERFDHMTVGRPVRSIWRCLCDCGEPRLVGGSNLLGGRVKDCGRHANPIPVGPALLPTELAWAAGMFEGEGSVRINSSTARNLGALLVDLPNTDRALVEWFQKRWPGYFRQGRLAGNKRDYWRWRIASLQAASFLIAIEPHIIGNKRERVLLGIEYQKQKRPSHFHNCEDGYRDRQRDYYERMKVLNERGALRGTQLLLLPETKTVGRRPRQPETKGRLAGSWR